MADKFKLTMDGGHHNAHHPAPPSDLDQMKERFAKLLLGEDMSGGKTGVSSALALSNAITNLSASVWGEQYRLEPMSAERRARWKKEVDWLLSVTDHIVEMVPSQQVGPDGTKYEIMTTQQRKDLKMNIPALKKLDGMLIEYLDNFKDQKEFWYVKRDADEAEKGKLRNDEKWWLPTVKVPPNGLSDASRKWILYQKELVNQVLKAAMAINANVIMEMEIPESYIDTLPKNGRATLGDSMYKSITVSDCFDPEEFLSTQDFSNEHKILDFKNKIEASVVIWKRKMDNNKDSKPSWGSGVSMEKREQFEERAETILLILKHKFPGLPQSSLDISKIQQNRDIGLAVLECYSRVLESLAFTLTSRIEDVLYADSCAQNPTEPRYKRRPSLADCDSKGTFKALDAKEEIDKINQLDGQAVTLSDFMGWQEQEDRKDEGGNDDGKSKKKPDIPVYKKHFYLQKIENFALKPSTPWH